MASYQGGVLHCRFGRSAACIPFSSASEHSSRGGGHSSSRQSQCPAMHKTASRAACGGFLSGLVIVATLFCCLAAAESATVADCNVQGFIFRSNVVPDTVRHLDDVLDPVQLYTLPYTPTNGAGGPNAIMPKPQDNLQSTVAACVADAACGIFTSDGYIISAYRSVEEGDSQQAHKEADIFVWRPMHYCTWDCCGTWVADSLIDWLLLPDTPGAKDVKITDTSQLPRDFYAVVEFNSALKTTACVGQPPPQSPVHPDRPASPPGSPGCPKRCLTACCKQLASGDKFMGAFFFSQCSSKVCEMCRYGGYGVAGVQVANVLLRQYVRDKSKENSNPKGGVSEDAKGPAAAANNGQRGSNCSLC